MQGDIYRLCDVGEVRAGTEHLPELKPDSVSALHHWPESRLTPQQIVDMVARTKMAPATVYFHVAVHIVSNAKPKIVQIQ